MANVPLASSDLEEPITVPDLGGNRLPGFDYLRVCFMLSVISTHANLVISWAVDLEKYVGLGPNFIDFFYLHIQSAAVPTFILLSSFLFCSKPVTWSRTRSRLKKLSFLYIFWVSAWVYYTRPVVEMNFLSILELVLRGGGWLFYFIAILILMTIQTAVIAVVSKKWQLFALGLCALILLVTEWYLTSNYRWMVTYYYWLPNCFVLLPSFAVWLSQNKTCFTTDSRTRWRWVLLLLTASIIAGLIEWHFSAPRELIDEARRWLPKHARFSIQFTALAIVIIGLGIRRQPGVIVKFLARNALGIYCLHGFVIGGFVKASRIIVGEYLPVLVIPLACVGVTVACALASEFLRKAFQHRLI